jgi:hypothetical protein
MATSTVETISVSFVKMKEDVAKPVPSYFIHEDEAGNPMMTEPVLIPIAPNPNERNETWKGYIKVEKAGPHYFRIDGDDVLTLKIPHAQVDITTGGGSLSTCATQQVLLERGFYYCELAYNNKAYKPVEKSYEGCKAAMSTEGVPQAGKYVQYDTSQSQLCGGEALTLMKLGEGCRIDWPEKGMPLANSITWYELRQDNNAVKHRYNTGTISEITVDEFNAMARVIYAESDTEGAEMKAIASVMLNRLGNTTGTAYRNPVLSMLTEFAQRDPSGKNPNWASVTDPQYAKVEGEKYKDIDRLSCEKLEEARKALEEVLSGGVTVSYDGFRTGGTTPKPHVTIGGTDFLTEKQYRTCTVKPEGWDKMPVWPGGPLDK